MTAAVEPRPGRQDLHLRRAGGGTRAGRRRPRRLRRRRHPARLRRRRRARLRAARPRRAGALPRDDRARRRSRSPSWRASTCSRARRRPARRPGARSRRPPGATGRRARSGGRAARSPRRGRPPRRSRSPPALEPTRSTAWWWWLSVRWSSSPAARAASEPPASRTGWSLPSNVPGLRRWFSWPWLSGRCCSNVPPRATFSTCMPRQIPRNGMSRAIAACASAISKSSRALLVLIVAGWRAAP